MTDAAQQFLDPALGSTMPRPPGLRAGDYPQQANAGAFRFWTIGISDRAIRQPFGDTVATPLHYEYDLCPSNLLAIACQGDPEHPDDRSLIQAAQDNPPQPGRVFTALFWYDWLHSGGAEALNRNLATKTGNAYLGIQNRGGADRPVLAVNGITPGGGTFLGSITNVTLSAPGNATQGSLACPLLREDGSAGASVPLRIPCWAGRWGFRGAAGQTLAAGATTQSLGYFLRITPATQPFIENAPALKLSFAGQSAEYGCEAYAALAYTMAYLDSGATYRAPDFDKQGPDYPCKDYGPRLWKREERTASVQIFLTPIGDSWQAVIEVHVLQMSRESRGGRYVVYGNFVPFFYIEKGTLSQTHPPDDITATPITFGAITTITRTLFPEVATLTLQIGVDNAGRVTQCTASINRIVPVTNSGNGWHDVFRMQ